MESRFLLRNGARYHELDDGAVVVVVVGRGSDCQVRLDDTAVSRRHCRFERDDDVVRVTDLRSRNGVQVNGQPLEGTRRIYHGDVIIVGATHLSLLVRSRVPVQTQEFVPFDDFELDEVTAGAGDRLAIYREGVATAVRAKDSLVAESSARLLLQGLRGAKHPPSPDTVEAALRVLLDLAELTGDRLWLEEIDALTEQLEVVLSPALQDRRRDVEAGRPPSP